MFHHWIAFNFCNLLCLPTESSFYIIHLIQRWYHQTCHVMPAGDCIVFCPWDISSSLCTVCHSPSLQPDAEKNKQAVSLAFFPLLIFWGVKCRTKIIKESVSLWCKTKAGQYLSFLSNWKKAALLLSSGNPCTCNQPLVMPVEQLTCVRQSFPTRICGTEPVFF